MLRVSVPVFFVLVSLASACAGTGARSGASIPCPIEGGWAVDELIEPDESHFAHLWQLTRGGENAEGYFNFAGDRISFQHRNPDDGIDCDRIFVLGGGARAAVTDGRGTTTCAYFYPDDKRVIFASTRGHSAECPPKLDYSQGYVWPVWPEFDLWVKNLETGALTQLTDEWGYDAEATVSPLGDRIVFTSTRSGDLELWTCDLDGTNLVQMTDEVGYDGGGFFSHDGQRIVFRTTSFTPGSEAEERETYLGLVKEWRVRPHSMEIMLIDADGKNRRQLTNLGSANFAPSFFPDDSRVIFSTSHHQPELRNFDLFAIDTDGDGLERITTYVGFDSFPIFDPSGRHLVFASNRGGTSPGETNLFLAQWR